ncbi:MAG: ribonuclease Z [Cyclobacteriaceae bacterium]
MAIELQILGSNSAAFAHNRHQTSQLLRVQDKYFLIDCGEGTQLLLKKYKIKLSRINHILISHLHGDHYYGLIGLLSTIHLYGRHTELMIIGPPGLSDILSLQFRYSETKLGYEINFVEWTPEQEQVVFEDEKMTIKTIPLNHRVPCSGYLFTEKTKRRGLNRKMITQKLTPAQVNDLKDGNDLFDDEGNLSLKNEEVTFEAKRPFTYAYCSDTKYKPELSKRLQGVDMVYHEATFMDDMNDRAEKTYHSTARQAAEFAKNAKIGHLLLGHFSTRYKDLTPLLKEAKSVFENSSLAIEGEIFLVS